MVDGVLEGSFEGHEKGEDVSGLTLGCVVVGNSVGDEVTGLVVVNEKLGTQQKQTWDNTGTQPK